jgi:hypothetical protein
VRRKLGISLVLILVVLAAGYGALWRYLAAELEAGAQRWAAAQRAAGATVAWNGLAVEGFPFRLRMRIDAPRFAREFALASPRIEFDLSVTNWRRSPWFADQGLAFESAAPDGSIVRAEARYGEGEAQTDPAGRLIVVLARFGDISVRNAAAPIATVSRIDARLEMPEISRPLDDSLRFATELRGASLAIPLDTPLGRDIAAAAIAGRWVGPLPRKLNAGMLEIWRTAGGTLEIDRIDLRWGPLGVAGSGTLALDRELQPMGSLSTRVTGHSETLDAFAGSGMIRPNDAAAAKLALGLLSRRPPAGGPAYVDVPVTAQNGRLFLGPAALARLPRIEWP